MQPQGPYTPPPMPPYGQAPTPVQPNPNNMPAGYEFMAATQPPHRTNLPQAPVSRILMLLGGLLALIIVFAIFKSLISGGGNAAELLTVVQDQQEITHIAADAQTQQILSTTNKYFTNTAALGVASDQTSTISYMAKNNIKVKDKQLGLKISAATDTQLSNAAAASSYDSVYKSIMQARLTSYQKDLKAAYAKTPGTNGRKLLNDNYDHAKLLLEQLDASTSQ